MKNLVLKDLSLCPLYHPEVKSVDFQDPNKTAGVGAVRACRFYQDSNPPNPEYVWEEVLQLDEESKVVMYIHDENRPAPIAYIGPVIYIDAMDSKTTKVRFNICYAPKLMPLTRFMATTVLKDALGAQAYKYAQALKVSDNTKGVLYRCSGVSIIFMIRTRLILMCVSSFSM